MKYEDYSLVNINIIIFIICIVIMTSLVFVYNISTYNTYKAIYIGKNTYEIVVDDRELKNFYNNGYLYLNDNKYIYEIDRINKNILLNDNKNYHELFIRFKYNKYKVNDIVDISILNKKKKIINMFIDIMYTLEMS